MLGVLNVALAPVFNLVLTAGMICVTAVYVIVTRDIALASKQQADASSGMIEAAKQQVEASKQQADEMRRQWLTQFEPIVWPSEPELRWAEVIPRQQEIKLEFRNVGYGAALYLQGSLEKDGITIESFCYPTLMSGECWVVTVPKYEEESRKVPAGNYEIILTYRGFYVMPFIEITLNFCIEVSADNRQSMKCPPPKFKKVGARRIDT